MARCVQSRVIVIEKTRLRALRERCTIPSPSGKSTIRVLRKKVRSECFGKKYGPSVSGKVHDPESVGKKRGSEQSDRYRKSAAQSASGKVHDPESVGKKHDPSASEKSTVRVLRKKRGSEQSDRYRKSTAQSIPVKVHSSEYFGKDKNLNRSAASRAVYKENLDRERERYIFCTDKKNIRSVCAGVRRGGPDHRRNQRHSRRLGVCKRGKRFCEERRHMRRTAEVRKAFIGFAQIKNRKII